uniref:Leucine-rich repeat-containing protein DDB_G0290503-like n=1 Tax=Saccoglossus kowalevskii TaxID=10224 RepID=A0ABM0M6J1_SACKO|nr:PREDICTED: putative leucine-rich repeat-containing protein DDB_G0290503-like [Saccoglossus kowalevskii]
MADGNDYELRKKRDNMEKAPLSPNSGKMKDFFGKFVYGKTTYNRRQANKAVLPPSSPSKPSERTLTRTGAPKTLSPKPKSPTKQTSPRKTSKPMDRAAPVTKSKEPKSSVNAQKTKEFIASSHRGKTSQVSTKERKLSEGKNVVGTHKTKAPILDSKILVSSEISTSSLDAKAPRRNTLPKAHKVEPSRMRDKRHSDVQIIKHSKKHNKQSIESLTIDHTDGTVTENMSELVYDLELKKKQPSSESRISENGHEEDEMKDEKDKEDGLQTEFLKAFDRKMKYINPKKTLDLNLNETEEEKLLKDGKAEIENKNSAYISNIIDVTQMNKEVDGTFLCSDKNEQKHEKDTRKDNLEIIAVDGIKPSKLEDAHDESKPDKKKKKIRKEQKESEVLEIEQLESFNKAKETPDKKIKPKFFKKKDKKDKRSRKMSKGSKTDEMTDTSDDEQVSEFIDLKSSIKKQHTNTITMETGKKEDIIKMEPLQMTVKTYSDVQIMEQGEKQIEHSIKPLKTDQINTAIDANTLELVNDLKLKEQPVSIMHVNESGHEKEGIKGKINKQDELQTEIPQTLETELIYIDQTITLDMNLNETQEDKFLKDINGDDENKKSTKILACISDATNIDVMQVHKEKDDTLLFSDKNQQKHEIDTRKDNSEIITVSRIKPSKLEENDDEFNSDKKREKDKKLLGKKQTKSEVLEMEEVEYLDETKPATPDKKKITDIPACISDATNADVSQLHKEEDTLSCSNKNKSKNKEVEREDNFKVATDSVDGIKPSKLGEPFNEFNPDMKMENEKKQFERESKQSELLKNEELENFNEIRAASPEQKNTSPFFKQMGSETDDMTDSSDDEQVPETSDLESSVKQQPVKTIPSINDKEKDKVELMQTTKKTVSDVQIIKQGEKQIERSIKSHATDVDTVVTEHMSELVHDSKLEEQPISISHINKIMHEEDDIKDEKDMHDQLQTEIPQIETKQSKDINGDSKLEPTEIPVCISDSTNISVTHMHKEEDNTLLFSDKNSQKNDTRKDNSEIITDPVSGIKPPKHEESHESLTLRRKEKKTKNN